MSQDESIESSIAKHNQACETLHEQFTENHKSMCQEVSRLALETMEVIEQPSNAFSKLLGLVPALRGTEIALYNITRQLLHDAKRETISLQKEHEAELKAKDEEIKALKESVHDLRENRRDKDDIFATIKEMNNFLLAQLQERKELYEAKEENMRQLMVEEKKQAVARLEAARKRRLPPHARFDHNPHPTR